MTDITESDTFGWGLLYALYSKHFTSKTNVMVCFTHFNLLRRGFRNVGIGEDISQPSYKEQSELLPSGWYSQIPYRLRYVYNRVLYFLIILDADEDGDVVINLSRPVDNHVAVTTLHLDEICQLNGHLESMMPDFGVLMQRLNEELIDPLVQNQASKDTEAQTEDERPTTSGIYHSVHDIPLPVPPQFRFVDIFSQPAGVGTSDLHPFGGGGGMIYQPPGMGPRPFMPDPILPPGAVPPGARFDPIMPNMPRGPMPRPRPYPRNSYPDPDHLPPPGYDDMFS